VLVNEGIVFQTKRGIARGGNGSLDLYFVLISNDFVSQETDRETFGETVGHDFRCPVTTLANRVTCSATGTSISLTTGLRFFFPIRGGISHEAGPVVGDFQWSDFALRRRTDSAARY